MMKIPWADPWIDQEEKEEINSLFKSRWFGMGKRTEEFEKKMRQYVGVKHAVAVSNGTVALDLALKALGIKPQDEVIVPAMTYVATVSAVLYQNATPVFADIERETFNIDPAQTEKLISKKTKCIIYIDYGGNPADHINLARITKEHGIFLLQDGAQSLGGEFGGQKLCKQGRISTTSFHIAKPITTVEGGMLFTEDDILAYNLRMMRNQGEDPKEKYTHRLLGTNARMTDLQAAFGLRQVEKLERILKRRAEIGNTYYAAFRKNKKIRLPMVRTQAKNAWFSAPILVENRDRFVLELNRAGIDTRVAYPMPVYEQPFFAAYKLRGQIYDCPNAKWMSERILNLPLFYAMTKKQINYVIENVLRVTEEVDEG